MAFCAGVRGSQIAIEVFEGNTGDPHTVRSQAEKLKHFGLSWVVLVADRGIIPAARISAIA